MSIQKKTTKDGQIRWVVRVWTDGRGSKRIKRTFDKKIDADEFLREMKSRTQMVRKSAVSVSNFEDTTFEEEANAWLEDGMMRFSASHVKRVKGILAEFFPKYGKLAPNEFTPTFLSALQRKLKQQGLKNATVNRKTEVITATLNFSVKHRRIPFNPASGFRKLPPDQEEMLFWDRSEAESFLEFADSKYPKGSRDRWVYCVYLLALNTALRAGEIWGLQPRDLLDGGDVIYLRRQFCRVKHAFGPPKGKRSRHVPCNEQLRRELKSLIEIKGTRLDQTIFHGEEGLPLNHDSFIDRRFERDVRLWGGRRIRFHDLRHTATTLMIGAGIDLRTVKEICGHRDIATTMAYTHVLGENLKNVAKSFSITPNSTPKTTANLRLIGK